MKRWEGGWDDIRRGDFWRSRRVEGGEEQLKEEGKQGKVEGWRKGQEGREGGIKNAEELRLT